MIVTRFRSLVNLIPPEYNYVSSELSPKQKQWRNSKALEQTMKVEECLYKIYSSDHTKRQLKQYKRHIVYIWEY